MGFSGATNLPEANRSSTRMLHATFNQVVLGSSPSRLTTQFQGLKPNFRTQIFPEKRGWEDHGKIVANGRTNLYCCRR
jgi:hypothetical protein